MANPELSREAVREAIRRSFLPPLLFVPDVARVLQVGLAAARKAILRGDCGPSLRFGRRIALKRESFLAALDAREVDSHPRPHLVVGQDAPSCAGARSGAQRRERNKGRSK